VIINNLTARLARARTKPSSEEAQTKIVEEISSEVHAAIKETRDISYDLRPSQLDRLGLTKAIAGVIRNVSEVSGISITSSLDNVDDLFAEDQRINLYRIVQESLTNIMKHAQATRIDVRIERTDRLMALTIHDDGVGFTPGAAERSTGKGGFGLSGMAERAQLLGGVFKVISAPGHGTSLRVDINAGG
jgi:signal transduction histidine kinase